MARTTLVALVAAATLVNSGCATMLSGTEQQVTIRTDPPDAEVIIDGVTQGKGSATVDLSRGDLHKVRVEHPDHEPATVALDTEMNPKTWLNMLLLPLFWVGFGVDAATGEHAWSIDLPRDHKWRASPTGADSKVWLMDHGGNVHVIDASSGETVHTAKLGEPDEDAARASVVVAHGDVFVRTNTALFCLTADADGAAGEER